MTSKWNERLFWIVVILALLLGLTSFQDQKSIGFVLPISMIGLRAFLLQLRYWFQTKTFLTIWYLTPKMPLYAATAIALLWVAVKDRVTDADVTLQMAGVLVVCGVVLFLLPTTTRQPQA